MLFRKVGAEKEEGRLKEDSLSETLRVLEETAAGLGEPNIKCPQIKKKQKKTKNITQTLHKRRSYWSEHKTTQRNS